MPSPREDHDMLSPIIKTKSLGQMHRKVIDERLYETYYKKKPPVSTLKRMHKKSSKPN